MSNRGESTALGFAVAGLLVAAFSAVSFVIAVIMALTALMSASLANIPGIGFWGLLWFIGAIVASGLIAVAKVVE